MGAQSADRKRKEGGGGQNRRSTKRIRVPKREAGKVGRRGTQVRCDGGRKEKKRERERGRPEITKGRRGEKKERGLHRKERKRRKWKPNSMLISQNCRDKIKNQN